MTTLYRIVFSDAVEMYRIAHSQMSSNEYTEGTFPTLNYLIQSKVIGC